jgi:threonine synthase
MQFVSTRGNAPAVPFSVAVEQGLAPDGGLYLPQAWPNPVPVASLSGISTLAELGSRLISPFLEGDPLAQELPAITAEAFNFPAPLIRLDGEGRLHVLELFHGPTAAFKDFGARFLAACMTRLRASSVRPLEILVATSGDTGGAVAAAFHRRPGIDVAVLFPKGLVSPTQERQLTCWGDNVKSFAVRGTFDDCQRLVKEAFVDEQMRRQVQLSSANSINLGRLLPQMVYYAASSLHVLREYGGPASYVIPSGNLGNAMACFLVQKLGLPIAGIHLAHNANRTVPDFLHTEAWRPRESIATLASAMDVGNPSNFERLRALFPVISAMRAAVTADSVDDDAIRSRIQAGLRDYGQIWCPHTAVAAEAHARLPAERRKRERWILVATAHPAKFREIVEPLLAREVAMPQSLAALFARPVAMTEIDSTLATLRGRLLADQESTWKP